MSADLLAGGKVKPIGRGRPKSRFRYFLADQGATPIIPRKSNEKKRERFNRGLYRERNRVERLINRDRRQIDELQLVTRNMQSIIEPC